MRAPDIQQYGNINQFLSDFYRINKRESASASFRYFAMKLKWPVSYLNDVIKSRKKLSIKRTLELGLFLKLDAVDMERLVFLSLKQNDDRDIFEFFSKKLTEEFDSRSYFATAKSVEAYPENFQIIDETIYSDISLLAIFDVVSWADGGITPDQIADCLFTFPELKNPEVLAVKMERLQEAKLIDPIYENGKVVRFNYLKKKLFFVVNSQTAHFMAQYAENYGRMVSSPDARAWIGSGFVMIPQDKILEVKKRIINLRNWVLSLDSRSHEDKRGIPKLVFQFDLNLFSLINDRDKKIGNLTRWGESLLG